MYSLASYHSFGFPSSAHALLTVSSSEELAVAVSALNNAAFYILGEGSNTVFLENYHGTVIKPVFKGITLEQSDSHYLLKVGAGENWHQLVLWCMQHNIYGFENLALIPGSVGAAPIQNIGAYGVEIEKFIYQVDFYDLATQQLRILEKHQCEFAYRDSVFKQGLANQALITSVTFALPKQWQAVAHYGELKSLSDPSAVHIFNQVIAIRQAKLPDPSKLGNAGSFFKNPCIKTEHYAHLQQNWPSIPCYRLSDTQVKVPAAWLIDQLGFKGKKVGGIGCHPTQPLVLTNDGTGTGEQLLQLAREIIKEVKSEFAIGLENEVRLIGKDGPVTL